MFALIRSLVMLITFAFAVIGVTLLLILWDIRQHPLSVFHYVQLLKGLPF